MPRNCHAVAAVALVATLVLPGLAAAQTANATSPNSQGGNSAAAPIGPSGGTASPQRSMGADKPPVGGNTKGQLDEEKKNDKDMTICKGC